MNNFKENVMKLTKMQKKINDLGYGQFRPREESDVPFDTMSVFELEELPVDNPNNSFKNVGDGDMSEFMNSIKINKAVDLDTFSPMLILTQKNNIIGLKYDDIIDGDDGIVDEWYNGDANVNWERVEKRNIPALYLIKKFITDGVDYDDNSVMVGAELTLDILMGFSRYIL
jgi:hypothetical protein